MLPDEGLKLVGNLPRVGPGLEEAARLPLADDRRGHQYGRRDQHRGGGTGHPPGPPSPADPGEPRDEVACGHGNEPGPEIDVLR